MVLQPERNELKGVINGVPLSNEVAHGGIRTFRDHVEGGIIAARPSRHALRRTENLYVLGGRAHRCRLYMLQYRDRRTQRDASDLGRSAQRSVNIGYAFLGLEIA